MLPHGVSRRLMLRATGASLLSAATSALPIAGLCAPALASSVAGPAGIANDAHGGGAVVGDSALPLTNRMPFGLDGLQFLSADVPPSADDGALARVRLFGDMHFGFTAPARLAAVASDLATLPPPDALLSTGDETHFGLPAEYEAARNWLGRWPVPFYTVTGNHTFWNAALHRQETSATQYRRFVEAWGQPMPYSWELGGVRFVGAGPIQSGETLAGASLSLVQIEQLGAMLASAPQQPTVLILHSPFRHTVLGDGGPSSSVFTSDDFDFFQSHGEKLRATLARAPQVALIINGHTHSPLHAQGLLTLLPVGGNLVPQFNAMALPFVHRDPLKDRHLPQDLVTWDLALMADRLVLTGRDHLARRDVARTAIPLPSRLPSAWSLAQRL